MAYIISIFSGSVNARINVPDLSCTSVSSGVQTVSYTVDANSYSFTCTDSPLQSTSKVISSANKIWQVTNITATSGSVNPPSWQDAIAAQDSQISALASQFSTLQTTIGSNGSDPATIAASTSIFAALLVAAVTVYGLKSVWGLFREPGGHD